MSLFHRVMTIVYKSSTYLHLWKVKAPALMEGKRSLVNPLVHQANNPRLEFQVSFHFIWFFSLFLTIRNTLSGFASSYLVRRRTCLVGSTMWLRDGIKTENEENKEEEILARQCAIVGQMWKNPPCPCGCTCEHFDFSCQFNEI